MKQYYLATPLLILLALTLVIFAWNIYNFTENSAFRGEYTLEINADSNSTIDLPRIIHPSERVYLIFDANFPLSLSVDPSDSLTSLPLEIEGRDDLAYTTILQRRFFYIANYTSSPTFRLKAGSYIRHYALQLLGTPANYSTFKIAEDELSYIGIRLEAKLNSAKIKEYSRLFLITPYGGVAEPDFEATGVFRVLGGKIAYINFVLMTPTTRYSYPLASPIPAANGFETFKVDLLDIELYTNRPGVFLGKKILYVAFEIGMETKKWSLNETAHAEIALGNLIIENAGMPPFHIPADAREEFQTTYQLYIFSKFTPSWDHFLMILALTFEIGAAAYLLLRKWRSSPTK